MSEADRWCASCKHAEILHAPKGTRCCAMAYCGCAQYVRGEQVGERTRNMVDAMRSVATLIARFPEAERMNIVHGALDLAERV